MNYEKIVTLYDTAAHADAARRNLEAAGFPARDISTITNWSLLLPGEQLREIILWEKLFGRDVEPYEASVYGGVVETGGVVLTVRVPDGDADKAMSILNAYQSVDLRKRAMQQGLMPEAAETATGPAQIATMSAASAASGDQVLPLAEEKLNVGKRQIHDGTTRIRRYVTETPVEAQVTLHEEHVQVIRRVVSESAAERDIDWSETTIEVTEIAEEPVVTKSVRIAEEVVIHREAVDHVRTLRDKVRRQQVEVEHVPPENALKE